MTSPADARTDAAGAADASPEALRHALREAGYVADPTTSTVAFLALRLDKPLLVEGPAGVGK
ncbi:MAG: AAA family ATPase, partial [Thermomicrobiales bacterium]